MRNFISYLLILSTLFPVQVFAAGRIQDSDVKSLTDVGGAASKLINTSKIYDSTNLQQLSVSIANGQLGGGSGSSTTILPNGAFSNNITGWTASGGTASFDSSAGNYATASGSLKFVATAGAQSVATASLPNSLLGKNAQAYCSFKTTNSDFVLQVTDGTNIINSVAIPATSSGLPFPVASVNFGANTPNLKLQVVSGSAGTINIDDCYMGIAQNLSQVSQAQFFGGITWPATASCTWSLTSATYANFAAVAACPTPNTKGNASAPSTKIPGITFANMPAGEYQIIASGKFNTTGGNQSVRAWRFSDGTNTTTANVPYGIVNAAIGSLVGHLSYSTAQTNVTIQLQAKTPSSDSAALDASGEDVTYSVYYFPTSSQVAVTSTAGGLNPGEESITASSVCPMGTLKEDGSAVSRSTYAALFTAIGTTYGTGDGSTTFNLPNAQGVFERGAGSQNIGGVNYSGTQGTTQGDQLQGHGHNGSISYFVGSGGGGAGVLSSTTNNAASSNQSAGGISVTSTVSDGTNGTARSGAETRPANISHLHCIRYVAASPSPVLITDVQSKTFNISTYLASGTRVTTTPAALGEYRVRYHSAASAGTLTDTAPTVPPTAADGMRIYGNVPYTAAGTAGQATTYDIFIGKNKTYKVNYVTGPGKTGAIDASYYAFSTTERGSHSSYDPTTGVVVVDTAMYESSGNSNHSLGVIPGSGGSVAADGYFDVQVSDNALYVSADTKSVTSNQSNERVERAAFDGGTITTPCTTTPCRIATQSGSWISSVSRSSAGFYGLNFASGTFSATPSCTCSSGYDGANLTACSVRPASNTFVNVYTGSGATPSDESVNVICMGPK